MARLAALVPQPRVNLTRYHGLFAPLCHLGTTEPPRVYRGLDFLRGWGDEQDYEVLPGYQGSSICKFL